MPDFTVQNLNALQGQLSNIGKNHFHVGTDGQVTATTSGVVGRFFGRVAALFGHSAREADQRNIEVL